MHAQQHTSALATLLEETGSLVSLPEVCFRLREVLDDPEHTRNQVAGVIMHEPSLTTRLLRIVNSAYFGLPAPVRDIPHALTVLGEQELKNMILVTSIVENFKHCPAKGLDMLEFWKTSVFCAVLTGNLAGKFSPSGREELFIAGLLLNIGKLPLYYHEPELYQEVSRIREQSFQEEHVIETKLLGFNHADVGAALAKKWNFSPLLAEAIGNHHDEGTADSLHCRIARAAASLSENRDPESWINMTSHAANKLAKLLPDTALPDNPLLEIVEQSQKSYRRVYEIFVGGRHGE